MIPPTETDFLVPDTNSFILICETININPPSSFLSKYIYIYIYIYIDRNEDGGLDSKNGYVSSVSIMSQT